MKSGDHVVARLADHSWVGDQEEHVRVAPSELEVVAPLSNLVDAGRLISHVVEHKLNEDRVSPVKSNPIGVTHKTFIEVKKIGLRL